MQLMESCPISFFNSVFELPLGVIVLSVLILLREKKVVTFSQNCYPNGETEHLVDM